MSGHLLFIVTPARVCSMVLDGDQATPTEGSYDSHVIKQEEQEEEDEGEFKMTMLSASCITLDTTY